MNKSILRFRVRYCETDQMGVVHHSKYFAWFENGRIDLLKKSGIDYAALEKNHEYFPVVSCAARYSSPAFFDDIIEAETVFLQAESNRIAFGCWLFRAYEDGGREKRHIAKLYSVHAYGQGGLKAALVPEWILEIARSKLWTGDFFSKSRRPPGF